jgi:hypothetical protein
MEGIVLRIGREGVVTGSASALEDETESIDDEDRNAGDEAGVTGDAVAAALLFTELARNRTSSDGDQGNGKGNDGQEEKH